MSGQASIRAALEQRLAAMAPALATAWENFPFQPPQPSVPYQRAYILFATPDDRETGAQWQEVGFMQVSLRYPLEDGPKDATARALAIQTQFKKGTTVTSGGVVVVVDRTPAIGNGTVDEDRWSVPVKIPFHAQIN